MRRPLDMQEIRRRALRAAAAAAGASVVACGSATTTSVSGPAPAIDATTDGATAADAKSPEDAAVADASSADAAALDVGAGDAGPADSGEADAGAADTTKADTTKADVAEADAISTDAATADASANCPDLEAGQPDCLALRGQPEWGTCCSDLGKWCSEKYPDDQNAASTCQFGPNYSGQCTGCIPWGPPAPPRFDESWRPQVQPSGAVYEVA